MAETQLGGRNIGDGSINHLDLSFLSAPAMTPVSGATNFVVWDSTAGLTKVSNLSVLEAYFSTKYSILAHSHDFSALTNKPTTLVGYGITDAEPAFSKNTAFNKNFGTIAGTVAQGDDSRILNGQTAFDWGNHASVGYALTSQLTGGTVTGTGTLNYLPKFTDTGAIGDSNISNSDNFTLINGVPNITGVNPVVLQIRGTQTSSAWTVGAKFVTLQFNSTDTSSTGAVARGDISMVMTDATGGFSDMVFGTTNTGATAAAERLRITSGGKLLIGSATAIGNQILQATGGLSVTGTGTTTDWIAGFAQSGVTLASSLVGTSQYRGVSVQAAGAALYHGWDTTNNVQFLMGVSGYVTAVVGSMTNHPLDFRTNNTVVGQFSAAGNLLLGSTTDNGINKLQVTGSGNFTTSVKGNVVLAGAGATDDTINKLRVIGSAILTENFSGVANKLTIRNGAVYPGAGSSVTFEGYYKHALISTSGNPSSTTGGDLWFQTYASDNTLNDGITIKRQGRVLINTTVDDGTNRLQVSGTTLLNGNTRTVGLTTFQGTVASDTAPLGVEQATTGTGTNWTGTDFTTGYTHSEGSVEPLTTTIVPTVGSYYQLSWVITGRTAGTVQIQFGDYTYVASASGNTAPYMGTATPLTLTPTTIFDGTITVSIKSIGVSTAVANVVSSTGTVNLEFRTSTNNTSSFVGLNAGRRNTLGGSNTGIGSNALRDVTSASNNTGIGYAALLQTTTGGSNTGVGTGALYTNRVGGNNSSYGFQSLYYSLGDSNVGVGSQVLYGNTLGNRNTSVGNVSLYTNILGNNNTALGYQSGRFIANGSTGLTSTNNSIYIGYNTKALVDSTTNETVIGYNQTGLGSNSTIIGGVSNTKTAIVGRLLLGTTVDDGTNQLQVTGGIISTLDSVFNTLTVGTGSGTGVQNTVVGYQTLLNATTGISNLAVGYKSLTFLTGASSQNVSIGTNAGRFIADGTTSLTTLNNSVFLGFGTKASGDGETNQTVLGFNQTGLGSNSTIIGGVGNTKTAIVGRLMLGSTTDDGINQLQVTGGIISTLDSSFNTVKVGLGNSGIWQNLSIGKSSLNGNTTGIENVAIGLGSLYVNTIGYSNTAIGYSTFLNLIGATNNNIAIGSNAGRYISGNTIALTLSNDSIFIGRRTKALADNQTNQIVLGSDATGLGSNTTVLGNSSTIQTWLGGRVTIGTTVNDGVNQLQVVGSVKSTSSVQVADSVVAASATNVGAIRYRSDANNSYMDMVMQTGASTYEWVNVVKNTWT